MIRKPTYLLVLGRQEKWETFVNECQTGRYNLRWTGVYDQTLLHCICARRPSMDSIKILLESWPQIIEKQDHDGCVPLHYAMTSGASDEILKQLISSNPGTLLVQNKWGYDAVGWIWKRYNENLKCINLENVSSSKYFQKCLNMAEFLVRSAAFDSSENPSDHGNILHRMTKFNCPSSLTMFLLSVYPRNVYEKDENGKIPLVCAIANSSSLEVIDSLLSIYPDAAKIPDDYGRLALHLAINSGIMSWNGGLENIFSAYPDAVTIRDPQTSLFPYMLSGAKNLPLDTIFTLLSLSPELINSIF